MMKRTLMVLLLAVALLGLSVVASAATYEGYTQAEFDALTQTTVIASEDSPTGYYVTFRYENADAAMVKLSGEFKFADPAKTDVYAGGIGTTEWQDGFIQMYTTDGWAVIDMERNDAGVWSYTIALPNGSYNYNFQVCDAEGNVLYSEWDPNNIPSRLNYEIDDTYLSDEFLSAVYVPLNAEKVSNDQTFLAACDEAGEVSYATMEMEDGTVMTYGMYLPYGFDAEREEPYKVMILSHGGGGWEGGWLNQGQANKILDNAIASGALEPTIVITPNATDIGFNVDTYATWLNDYMFPYLAENYNASLDAADHAMAGLSAGSGLTTRLYCLYTDMFGYYCMMSGGGLTNYVTQYELDLSEERFHNKNITIACGLYDGLVYDSIWANLKLLNEEGITHYNYYIPGAHTWNFWQNALNFFTTEILWK